MGDPKAPQNAPCAFEAREKRRQRRPAVPGKLEKNLKAPRELRHGSGTFLNSNSSGITFTSLGVSYTRE